MSDKQYSLDDIVADAKKIRAKQQLEKQRQTSFQRLDNLGYKKMKIGNTTELSRLTSKTPISDKGKLFYTMQLRKLKEDTMRSLEKKSAAGLDVSKLIEERDIRRKQVLSDVVKMSEQSNADKAVFEKLEKNYTEQLEKKTLQKQKKEIPARPQDTPSMQKDLQSALKKPKKAVTPPATKTPSPAKKEMPKTTDTPSGQNMQGTFEVRVIDDNSNNISPSVKQELFDMIAKSMNGSSPEKNEPSTKEKLAEPIKPIETSVPQQTFEKPSAPPDVPEIEKTQIAKPAPRKQLDMGFVAQDTTELELEKRRIKKATNFVLDEEIFKSITADIPAKKIKDVAPPLPDYTEEKTTIKPTIKPERDDFPKSQTASDEVDLFDGEEVTGIRAEIVKNYTKSALSSALMFFVTLLSLYISLAPEFNIPMPDILNPQSNPFGFVVANIVLIAVSAIICRTVIYYGAVNLFTLKADNDSLSAMATIAVLIQNLVLLLSPHTINAIEGINIYTPLAILGLFANQIGRLLATTRMVRNVKMAYSTSKNKYATIFLPPDTAQTAMLANASDDYNVLAPMKTERFTGFIDNSVSEDLSDTIATILAPIVFVASLIITLFCYIIYRDINLSLTALSATFCICSPFSALIISNLPLNIISKKLYSVGGIVTGYDALEATADADAIVVSAGDLFPKGTILLHDIKTFEQAKIDEVLLDTASVILRVGGTLQDVFSQIIMNQDSMLSDVDSIVYEDSMGVSAWINSKRVLIGNRHLMQNHGVNVPSQAYEQKYKKDNREIVYLATSGTLAAMFVVSYKADEKIKRALHKLVRADISLCVKTSDANISADKLADIFEIPADSLVVMPSEIYREYTEVTKRARTAPITTAFLGNVLGYLGAVTAAKKARKTVFISTIMQTAGIALGYVLVAYFAFMQGLTQIDVVTLLIYQLSWFLVSWAIVKFNSY